MNNDQETVRQLILSHEVTKRLSEYEMINQQRELEALKRESNFWREVNLKLEKPSKQSLTKSTSGLDIICLLPIVLVLSAGLLFACLAFLSKIIHS